MTGALANHDMTLVLSSNRISGLGKTDETQVPKEATTVDCSGKFLIPGLWDIHVHLWNAGESMFPLFIAHGVTSVRDMGGDVDELKEWRRRVETGALLGPRIKIAGPMLEGQAGPGGSWGKNHIIVSSPLEAEQIVKSLAEKGADFIKVRGYASPETYFALAAAAKRANLKLVGHAPWGIDPVAASDAGQASFEHGFYPWPLDKIAPDELRRILEQFVKNGTTLVPTLVTWQSRTMPFDAVAKVVEDSVGALDYRRRYVSDSLVENWRKGLEDRKREHREDLEDWKRVLDGMAQEVGTMYRAGVRVMAGTDVGATLVYPGFDLHSELNLLVRKVGMTPHEALQSATSVPADFCGMLDSLGTIETGKIADLVLLEANPLEDIANARLIDAVVFNGQYLPKTQLHKLMEDVETAVRDKGKTRRMGEVNRGFLE
jgi:imidazolonepropionase-like amidohydrolase